MSTAIVLSIIAIATVGAVLWRFWFPARRMARVQQYLTGTASTPIANDFVLNKAGGDLVLPLVKLGDLDTRTEEGRRQYDPLCESIDALLLKTANGSPRSDEDAALLFLAVAGNAADPSTQMELRGGIRRYLWGWMPHRLSNDTTREGAYALIALTVPIAIHSSQRRNPTQRRNVDGLKRAASSKYKVLKSAGRI